MNLIDTHCHLDFPEFDRDRQDVVERALSQGVIRMLNVSSGFESLEKTLELTRTYSFIYGTVGIHPHYADSVDENKISYLAEMAKSKKVLAIGEVGLDYYRNKSSLDNQKNVFLKFVNLAKNLKLPLVIHSRNAMGDVLAILKEHYTSGRGGVFHCFSGTEADLNEVLGLGFYVSFTCNLTFKNASRLRDIAKRVPTDRLLLETDAPFLAPQKYRGKRNEPAYLVELIEALSEIKGIPKDEIAEITTRNADELFFYE